MLSHSGPDIAALIRLVVHACPSPISAGGCSLFGWLGVIQLTAGSVQSFGVKEGGIDYAQNQYNKELLGDLPTRLDEIKQKIADGEIKVPVKPAT